MRIDAVFSPVAALSGTGGCMGADSTSKAANSPFYGCHNRAPITTFGKATCQYTYTALGQADTRCAGYFERKEIPQ